MFGFNDFLKFFSAFFVIFPIVTVIHLCGHLFFVTIYGGREKKIVVGCGRTLFSLWKVEIRTFYFWSGGCEFKKLGCNTRMSNTLIFLGGSIFNLASILLVNLFIFLKYMEPSVWSYQFQYFSFNTMFFALFPMDFPNGTPSDGKAVWLLWKNRIEDKHSDDLIFRDIEEELEKIQADQKEKSRDL
ncbi:hypothetical protein [Peribacillus deserti]|uniref:Peptidase M50 domain-containing protein n=1 Tax=Peribacillus deserti TaxID=673318 RepID=A0A2N5LZE3_9BACI|nr:hypothetical protein [Peribacillus deserti]PLT27482.1 hypothetical protein CUU66_23645 [Peribacillus deserti]